MADYDARAALRRKTDQTLTSLEKLLGVPARRRKNLIRNEIEESQRDNRKQDRRQAARR
jgi:hypothetical protein